MTFEKRCTVEPTDFLALVYECAKCGASTRVPLGKEFSGSGPNLLTRNCWQCNEPTGIASGTEEHVTIHQFAEALKHLADKTKGRNLKVKMELKCVDVEPRP